MTTDQLKIALVAESFYETRKYRNLTQGYSEWSTIVITDNALNCELKNRSPNFLSLFRGSSRRFKGHVLLVPVPSFLMFGSLKFCALAHLVSSDISATADFPAKGKCLNRPQTVGIWRNRDAKHRRSQQYNQTHVLAPLITENEKQKVQEVYFWVTKINEKRWLVFIALSRCLLAGANIHADDAKQMGHKPGYCNSTE